MLTGNTFTDRPHPHPITRQRCEGTLVEFVVQRAPARGFVWVSCDSCPAIGELADELLRRPGKRIGDRTPIEGVEHGTPSGYWNGCRCHPCTDAHSLDDLERRRQLVS